MLTANLEQIKDNLEMIRGFSGGYQHLAVRGKARKMRKGRFPPFGFVLAEFGLQAPILQSFWRVFVFRSNGQKDARGLISPLWVHMEGV